MVLIFLALFFNSSSCVISFLLSICNIEKTLYINPPPLSPFRKGGIMWQTVTQCFIHTAAAKAF